VLRDEVQLLAGGDVEALHLFGVGGEDDPAMVGRDVGDGDLRPEVRVAAIEHIETDSRAAARTEVGGPIDRQVEWRN